MSKRFLICLTPCFIWLLAACYLGQIPKNQFSFCEVPAHVSVSDLVGRWEADYSKEYASDPITGTIIITNSEPFLHAADGTMVSLRKCELTMQSDAPWTTCWLLRGSSYKMHGRETLLLNNDLSYRHSFFDKDVQLDTQVNHWEMIEDAGDSPKIRLNGMKYYGDGVPFSTGDYRLYLHPQRFDLERAGSKAGDEHLPISVKYPDSGFVYLYPRVCSGELVLWQMMSEVPDPDNSFIFNPIFRKKLADATQ